MAFISSYTFYAHEGLRSHTHSHGHIIIVLNQTFYISFAGREYTLTPDLIVFVPPGVNHVFGCTGQALTLNIPAEMIKSTDLLILTDNCVLEISDRLRPLVSLIKQEVEGGEAHSDSLRYLFYYLYDKFVEQYRLPSLQYLQENYASDINIARLAAIENYNVTYYTSWFKKKTGCTPSDYLKMVRIEKAKEMLFTTRYRHHRHCHAGGPTAAPPPLPGPSVLSSASRRTSTGTGAHRKINHQKERMRYEA